VVKTQKKRVIAEYNDPTSAAMKQSTLCIRRNYGLELTTELEILHSEIGDLKKNKLEKEGEGYLKK
jgi:hypothetical protein